MRSGIGIVATGALGIALGVTGLGATALAAPVTSDELLNAQDNRAEWLMYGRDYRNQRFSPLDQITPDNVAAAAAGLGVLDRRQPCRRSRRRPCSATACSTSRPTTRGCSRSMPRSGTVLWRFEPGLRGGHRDQAVLRPGQPRRRAQGRAGVRQHARRQALRAQPQRRLGRLAADDRRLAGRDHRDRRAARGRRQGDRRHRRRRVRRARLPHRLRCRERRAALADLHDPGPRRARQRDLARRHLADTAAPPPGRPAPTMPRPTRCSGAPATRAPGTRT